MNTKRQFDTEIDKLTRSIENLISGDSFKTDILALTRSDVLGIKTNDWLFNWKEEAKDKTKIVFKLVIIDNPDIIQGLISLEDKGDHVFMHLIESNKFNRGQRKVYLGVPGNLVAFACKLSIEKGYEGFVSFESKTRLIEHYQQTLGAHILFNNIMAIDSIGAKKLVMNYFPEIL